MAKGLKQLLVENHNRKALQRAIQKGVAEDFIQQMIEEAVKREKEYQKMMLKPGVLIKLKDHRWIAECTRELFEEGHATPEEVAEHVTELYNDGEGGEGRSFEPGDILMYLGYKMNRFSKTNEPIWLFGEKKYHGYIHPDDFDLVRTR